MMILNLLYTRRLDLRSLTRPSQPQLRQRNAQSILSYLHLHLSRLVPLMTWTKLALSDVPNCNMLIDSVEAYVTRQH